MTQFHAHIYFAPHEIELANVLVQDAVSSKVFNSIKLFEHAVGPHPTAMIEMHFDDRSHNLAVNWVKAHRKNFSVLIHQDTGDDIKDHTDGIHWLGEMLFLDFDFFELIKTRPDLRVHP